MEVTEVRVMVRVPSRRSAGQGQPGEVRLKAFATVTFDHCFVVRNIKVIDGKNGLFIAMPSEKPKAACAGCHGKNDLGARFCGSCGKALPPPPRPVPAEQRSERPSASEDAPAHRDIVHPITAEFRQLLQRKVLEVYEAELANVQAATPASTVPGETLAG